MMNDLRYIASAPHQIHWAGFRSSTRDLQAMGWQISAEQDFMRGVRLVLKNEDHQMICITDSKDIWHWQERIVHNRADNLLTFNVVRMGGLREFFMQYMDESAFAGFGPVDAKPQFMQIKNGRLDDLVPFAAPLAETKELIVDEDEVSAILAKLIEAQKPEQERIRARQRLRESREGMMLDDAPRRKFHAQILSIAA